MRILFSLPVFFFMTTVLSLCKCFPGKLNGDGKVLKESLVGVKVKLLVFDQLSADRR